MHARCPNCKTLYRVSAGQLELAAGLLRCGQCLCVFQAHTEDADTEPAQEEVEIETGAQHPPTGSDTDPYFQFPAGERTAEAEPQSSAREDDEVLPVLLAQRDETDEPSAAAPTEQAPRPTSGEGSTDDRPELILHDLSDTAEPKRRYRPLLSVLIAALLLGLGLQFAWYERSTLAHIDWLQPWIERACARLDCRIAERRDLDSIQLLDRSVSSHPSVDRALIISATMVNNAAFRQPFPLLMVSMSDIRGQVVARRHFRPTDYLEPQTAADGMVPGAPVAVVLEVTDPGGDALTFELEFF